MTPYVHSGCNPESPRPTASRPPPRPARRWPGRRATKATTESLRMLDYSGQKARASARRRRSVVSIASCEPSRLPSDVDAGGRRVEPARRNLPHRLRGSRISHGLGRLCRARRRELGAPVARAGHDDGYIDAARVVWADVERGRGPIGAAIRSGKAVWVQDYGSTRASPRGAKKPCGGLLRRRRPAAQGRIGRNVRRLCVYAASETHLPSRRSACSRRFPPTSRLAS